MDENVVRRAAYVHLQKIKIALAIIIIREKPDHITAKQYAKLIQERFRCYKNINNNNNNNNNTDVGKLVLFNQLLTGIFVHPEDPFTDKIINDIDERENSDHSQKKKETNNFFEHLQNSSPKLQKATVAVSSLDDVAKFKIVQSGAATQPCRSKNDFVILKRAARTEFNIVKPRISTLKHPKGKGSNFKKKSFSSQTGLSSIHSENLSSLHSEDVSLLHSEDVSLLHSEDVSLLHSEDVSLLHSEDVSLLHSEDVSLLHSENVSLLHSENVSLHSGNVSSSIHARDNEYHYDESRRDATQNQNETTTTTTFTRGGEFYDNGNNHPKFSLESNSSFEGKFFFTKIKNPTQTQQQRSSRMMIIKDSSQTKLLSKKQQSENKKNDYFDGKEQRRYVRDTAPHAARSETIPATTNFERINNSEERCSKYIANRCVEFYENATIIQQTTDYDCKRSDKNHLHRNNIGVQTTPPSVCTNGVTMTTAEYDVKRETTATDVVNFARSVMKLRTFLLLNKEESSLSMTADEIKHLTADVESLAGKRFSSYCCSKSGEELTYTDDNNNIVVNNKLQSLFDIDRLAFDCAQSLLKHIDRHFDSVHLMEKNCYYRWTADSTTLKRTIDALLDECSTTFGYEQQSAATTYAKNLYENYIKTHVERVYDNSTLNSHRILSQRCSIIVYMCAKRKRSCEIGIDKCLDIVEKFASERSSSSISLSDNINHSENIFHIIEMCKSLLTVYLQSYYYYHDKPDDVKNRTNSPTVKNRTNSPTENDEAVHSFVRAENASCSNQQQSEIINKRKYAIPPPISLAAPTDLDDRNDSTVILKRWKKTFESLQTKIKWPLVSMLLFKCFTLLNTREI